MNNITDVLSKCQITRVADVTGLDVIGIPVYLSFRPNSKSLAVAAGKGVNAEQSKTSAIMEAAESYFAENSLDIIITHPLNDKLYAQYDIYNFKSIQRIYSYQEFIKQNINWTSVSSLLIKKSYLVPNDLVHLDMRQNDTSSNICVSANGLAIHHNKSSAILHAMYELVERDAFALWFNSTLENKVKTYIPESLIKFDSIIRLIEKIRSANLELYLFNLTSDTRVPSFLALITKPGIKDNEILNAYDCNPGYGSSLCVEESIMRAITEAAQSRLGVINASRDDFFHSTYLPKRYDLWFSIISAIKNSRSIGYEQKCNETYQRLLQIELKSNSPPTLVNELIYRLKCLFRDDLEILYKYLGGNEINLFAVRVFIPNLENDLRDSFCLSRKRGLLAMFQ